MAYIGRRDSGTNDIGTAADTKQASKFTASSTFTASWMGFLPLVGFVPGEFVKLGIYSDNAGEPNALLGTTSAIEGLDIQEYIHAKLATPVAIGNGTVYWLAVIWDSAGGLRLSGIANAAAGNVDNYADGFADPFGVHDDFANRAYCIFASDDHIGDLGRGGAVVETSGGTKYAVVTSGSDLVVYKDIDGAFTLEDSDSADTVHGGNSITWCHAAMDSNDDIHIVCSCIALQTRDVAYAIYDTGTDTLGAWEEAADYTDAAPTNPGCSISIDSGDVPCVLYVDKVTYHGTDYDQVYYTQDDAPWAAGTQINGTANENYSQPTVTLRNNDDIEAFYYNNTDGDPCYNTFTAAAWVGEAVYAETTANIGFGGVISTTGGTAYRYHADDDEDIEENNVDTTYNTDAINSKVSAALVDDSVRYVFYIDINDDVHLISNNGGGWVDEGALQGGTYPRVICEWAYNNENQTCINYIFDDSADIFYWDEFCFGVVRIPRHPAHYNPYYVV